MHLTYLVADELRAFLPLDMNRLCGFLLLVGNNAQGKNQPARGGLLPATLSSFHAQMIAFKLFNPRAGNVKSVDAAW
jgi:hypothetical protein